MALTNAFLGTQMRLCVAPPAKPLASAPRQVTSMAKKKGIRCIVTLECTEARPEGATPSRYVTQKVGFATASCVATALGRVRTSPRKRVLAVPSVLIWQSHTRGPQT